jgi:hypothetical protein
MEKPRLMIIMIMVCYRGWFYIPLSHILLPIIIMYISHPHDLMVGNIPWLVWLDQSMI